MSEHKIGEFASTSQSNNSQRAYEEIPHADKVTFSEISANNLWWGPEVSTMFSLRSRKAAQLINLSDVNLVPWSEKQVWYYHSILKILCKKEGTQALRPSHERIPITLCNSGPLGPCLWNFYVTSYSINNARVAITFRSLAEKRCSVTIVDQLLVFVPMHR